MQQSAWVATCKSLNEIERLIKEKLDDLTDTHLTITQAYVLQALYAVDGQQPTELARYTGREATSFTPVLDAIEALDLVRRKPSSTDRRAVGIYLTHKGRVLARVVTEALAEVEAEYSK